MTRREYSLGVLAGAGISLVFVIVFYNTLKALPLILLLMPLWLRWWSGEMQQHKQRIFAAQLREALRMLSSSLEAGRSLENAICGVCEEMERQGEDGSLVGREFNRMRQQLAVNWPVERAWQSFAGRTGQRDVVEIAMVVSAGKRAGGNLISAMKKSTLQIAERMDVDREIDTILSSKKTELLIMLAMPIGILLYMRLVFSEMIAHLYRNAAGVAVMSLALILYLAAAWWGQRIIRIEV